MEIKYAMIESVPVEKIKVADTFEHAGDVFLKLERTYIPGESAGHTYNAINLKTADLVCLPVDMMVRPVRASLTIS